jgi:hypothetical protein
MLSNSQLKLSRKPSKLVVSDGEKRSADEGKGGGWGKMAERAGSKEKSKSANGTGVWGVVEVEEDMEWTEVKGASRI